MASLYIAEFDKLLTDSEGRSVMAPHFPPIVEQKLTISGSSVPSTAFTQKTRYIQIHCDAICSIVVGPAVDASGNAFTPAATNANARMAANETRFIGVDRGSILAVITNS